MLKKWDDLPDSIRLPEVKPYWEVLYKKRAQLLVKRICDILISILMLAVLAIPMAIIALVIKIDSPGPVFYRQERVTTYGRRFRIHKFRTMVNDADKKGSAVTLNEDLRITKIGAKLRVLRLDELPQVLDVLFGNMTFVGTRPEIVRYVEQYRPEYYATLLIPAGVTSEASIRFKDEAKLLDGVEDVDRVYLEKVLPAKMRWNLDSITNFSLMNDFVTMIRTLFAVSGKKYEDS